MGLLGRSQHHLRAAAAAYVGRRSAAYVGGILEMSTSPIVFISWSGDKSKAVAGALRGWLPLVIQSAEPWMSAADISKGSRWEQDIAAKLEEASVGIVCLTPQNLASTWLHFEVGALSKKVGKARVCPYLLGLQPEDVDQPLGMFQMTVADEPQTFHLVETINECQERPLPEGHLRKTFDLWWPGLKQTLHEIAASDDAIQPKREVRDMVAEILAIIRKMPDDINGALRSATVDAYLEAMQESVAPASWGAGTSGRSGTGGWGTSGSSGRSGTGGWGTSGSSGRMSPPPGWRGPGTSANRNAPGPSGPSLGARATASGSGVSDQSNKAGGAAEPEE